MKRSLFSIVFFSLSAVVGSAYAAESTVILEHSQKIIELSDRMAKMTDTAKRNERSTEAVDEWHRRALRAPQGSPEYLQAVSGWAKAKIEQLEPLAETLAGLDKTNEALIDELEALERALAENRRREGPRLEDLPPEARRKVLDGVSAFQDFARVLSQNPAIAGSPKYEAAFHRHKQAMTKVLDPRTGRVASGLDIRHLREVMEARGELIALRKEQVLEEVESVKVTQLDGMSGVVEGQLNRAIKNVNGALGNDGGRKTRQQVDDLLRRNRGGRTAPPTFDGDVQEIDRMIEQQRTKLR